MNGALVQNSGFLAPVNVFADSLFDRYSSYVDVKETTLKGYLTGLQSFRNWISNNAIIQPERDDIKQYKRYLSENGYKVGTQARYFRIVKHFFKWLASEGLYPNIADNIKGAKVSTDNTKKDAFDRADLNTVLQAIDTGDIAGKRDFALIQLCATCALRIIEINRANIEDLQMLRGEHILFIQGKGHDEKDEYVKIPEEVFANIEAYLALRKDCKKGAALFASVGNRVSIKEDGTRINRLTEPSLSTIIKKRFKNAGYNTGKLTAHSLRHTGVTALLKANGGYIQQAQRFARHKNLNTTLIYSHNIEREKDHSEQMVYNYLFGNDTQMETVTRAIDMIKPLTAEQVQSVIDYIKRISARDEQKPA